MAKKEKRQLSKLSINSTHNIKIKHIYRKGSPKKFGELFFYLGKVREGFYDYIYEEAICIRKVFKEKERKFEK